MRTLREIAKEVRSDWKAINNDGAREALACMEKMGNITDRFGADPNGTELIRTS
jgi:hypothetical protein